MPPEIIPFDLHRMFIGDAPPLFLLEIAARTLLIYLYTLLLLRWVGGRSVAQLSIVEFLMVIALGSAVGDSLFYPDVPLLHAMLVITLVVLFDKAIDAANRRFRKVKRVIDGQPVAVVEDGHILCDGIATRRIGTMELMELLRMQGIENMGQVRVAYLEASGQLSVFQADQPQPGLAIVPPVEFGFPPPVAGQPSCCANCGLILESHGTDPCPACKDTGRTPATTAA
ncbi:DUF421 domain-containing protein [Fertoebacter nigrum]|uniref:DUF421 domain-containing protein n=1 Tax=Fertoeibacter niger TaxID=2656921 RepID=A0A8X8KKV5_9RHOB|nr:DUF421 domain-containing protein [Fertoeibacter niger]